MNETYTKKVMKKHEKNSNIVKTYLVNSALVFPLSGDRARFCKIWVVDGLNVGSGWIIILIRSKKSLLSFCGSGGSSPLRRACQTFPFLGKGPEPVLSIIVIPKAKISAFVK